MVVVLYFCGIITYYTEFYDWKGTQNSFQQYNFLSLAIKGQRKERVP